MDPWLLFCFIVGFFAHRYHTREIDVKPDKTYFVFDQWILLLVIIIITDHFSSYFFCWLYLFCFFFYGIFPFFNSLLCFLTWSWISPEIIVMVCWTVRSWSWTLKVSWTHCSQCSVTVAAQCHILRKHLIIYLICTFLNILCYYI